jgi:hypothetical protein
VIALPCISADGKPTKSGIATLSALKSGVSTPKAVAEITGHPLFKVRSGLRELVGAVSFPLFLSLCLVLLWLIVIANVP